MNNYDLIEEITNYLKTNQRLEAIFILRRDHRFSYSNARSFVNTLALSIGLMDQIW